MTTSTNAKKDTKLKFIYWFAYYNLDSPSVRYRAKYPLGFLKKNYSINSCFIYPSYIPILILKFIKAYFSALFFRKANSLIVVQRVHSDFIYANLLKLLIKVRNQNSIYDIDDADYLERKADTLYYFSENCSKITVGSHELQVNLSKFNRSIFVNTSPTPDLNIVKGSKNKLLTIGWIGGFGGDHKKSLMQSFFPALKNLPFKVKLILLGVVLKSDYYFLKSYFDELENVELEMPQNIDWNNEVSIQNRIATFDIGIATLLDNELQRSKSAFKAKQYLNNGIPVLSSDVPENNLFVVNGSNGFLCSTTEEFRGRIVQIFEMNQQDYKSMSINARNSIKQFDLNKYAQNLMALYN